MRQCHRCWKRQAVRVVQRERMQQQTVCAPTPQVLEETVEVGRLVQHERVQQRTAADSPALVVLWSLRHAPRRHCLKSHTKRKSVFFAHSVSVAAEMVRLRSQMSCLPSRSCAQVLASEAKPPTLDASPEAQKDRKRMVMRLKKLIAAREFENVDSARVLIVVQIKELRENENPEFLDRAPIKLRTTFPSFVTAKAQPIKQQEHLDQVQADLAQAEVELQEAALFRNRAHHHRWVC